MDDDIAQEIETIETDMADDFAGYQGNAAKQARYGELLAAQEAGTAAPAQPDAATARRTEIEGMMGDPRSPYWKGSKADKLQAEYRSLLGDERPRAQANAVGADRQAVALTDGDVSNAIENVAAMGDTGAEWAAELSKGGAKGALGHMEDTRLAILGGMGAAAGDVAQAFDDNLSDNVRASVFRELANPYVPRLPPASRDDLATFAEAGAGAILVKEWGADAARNLAVALHRWDRLTQYLSDEEFDQLDDFYLNRLTDTERAAILRRLAT